MFVLVSSLRAATRRPRRPSVASLIRVLGSVTVLDEDARPYWPGVGNDRSTAP